MELYEIISDQIRYQVLEVMIISLHARMEAADAISNIHMHMEKQLVRAQIVALEMELIELKKKMEG